MKEEPELDDEQLVVLNVCNERVGRGGEESEGVLEFLTRCLIT